jgi:integrase
MSKTKKPIQYEGVRAASESSIEIDFYYNGVRCKERRKLKPTPANLRRASIHRGAVLSAIEAGTFDYASTYPTSKKHHKFRTIEQNLLLGDYLSLWFSKNRAAYKASTYDDHELTIQNQIIPALGDIPLTDLHRVHVREWADTLTCGLKRVRNIIGPLRTALKHAVKDDYLETNPLTDWEYTRHEPPKEEHVIPFTRKEQAAILSAAKGQSKNFIQFAFWSGLRTSELVALTWYDIDFDKGEIRINKAKTKAADKPETPKTKASIRRVKLLPPAREALKAQKELTTDLVFINEEGTYLTPNDINKDMWKPALKEAGVKYRNPYQTRHTYASMMLSAKEPLLWVSHQMGHADVLVTAKKYIRWIPESDPLVGSRAVEMFT